MHLLPIAEGEGTVVEWKCRCYSLAVHLWPRLVPARRAPPVQGAVGGARPRADAHIAACFGPLHAGEVLLGEEHLLEVAVRAVMGLGMGGTRYYGSCVVHRSGPPPVLRYQWEFPLRTTARSSDQLVAPGQQLWVLTRVSLSII